MDLMSSMTPPSSPTRNHGTDLESLFAADDFDENDFLFSNAAKKQKLEDEVQQSIVHKFECHDTIQNIHKLLTPTTSDVLSKRMVSIFKMKILSLCGEWLCNEQQHFFYEARMKVMMLTKPCTAKRLSDMKQEMNEVISFLDEVCFALNSLNKDRIAEAASSLVPELELLYALFGPMQQNSPLGNASLLKMCLHFRFSFISYLLKILHIISSALPYHQCLKQNIIMLSADHELGNNFSNQIVQQLFLDSLPHSVKLFKETSMDLSVSPWICSCHEKLLASIIQLHSCRDSSPAKESFWVIVSPLLEFTLQNPSARHFNESTCIPVYQCIKVEDRLGFLWWMLKSLVQLHNSDLVTSSNETSSSDENYCFVEKLLRQSLNAPEVLLRFHLKCFRIIYSHWNSNAGIIALLWNHFYRKLDDAFLVSNSSLVGLQCIRQSTESLLKQVISYTDDVVNDQLSSFDLFLKLVAIHLQSTKNWPQLKGRIYSKFHTRRIQELSEMGLYHVACLYLLLSYIVDLQDVADKLCDLFEVAQKSCATLSCQTIVWRCYFVEMVFHIRKGKDISYLVSRLKAPFTKVSNEFSAGISDLSRRMDVWTLISVYFDGFDLVLKESDELRLSEMNLLFSGLDGVLNQCRTNELVRVLEFIHKILKKIKLIVENHGRLPDHLHDSVHILCKEAIPFIRTHSCTLTPPSVLSDFAADFFLLLSSLSKSLGFTPPESHVSLCSYLGLHEDVNASFLCSFLAKILQHTEAILSTFNSKQQLSNFLTQCWFRCCLCLPEDSTREMLSFAAPFILINEVPLNSCLDCPFKYENLFVFIHQQYSGIQDLKEKMKFKHQMQTMFTELSKFMHRSLERNNEHELLHTYAFIGYMVKYCAPLIYTKSQSNCFLPNVIQTMILRRKAPSPQMQAALSRHGYLMVSGFAYLDFMRDPFISRKLREIVHFFMHNSQRINTSNILLQSLFDSCGDSFNKPAADFRKFVLQIIRDDFLTKSSVDFTLIDNLLQSTLNMQQLAEDNLILLKPCILSLIASDHKTKASSCVKSLMSGLTSHSDGNLLASLKHDILSIFSTQFNIHPLKVFRSIEPICCHCPVLMKQLIPHMTSAVRDSEKKRGVGIDKQLRGAYCQLLVFLGQEGEEEKSKLLQEALSV